MTTALEPPPTDAKPTRAERAAAIQHGLVHFTGTQHYYRIRERASSYRRNVTVQPQQKFYEIDLWPFISPQVPSVREDETTDAAVAAFSANPYGVVYVTKPQSRVLSGVITLCDLAKLNSTDKPRTAKQLATTENVVAIRTDAKLWQALRMVNGDNILQRKLDRLPVVDARNNLVGVVTASDLHRQLDNPNLSELTWPQGSVASSGTLSY